MKHFSKVVTGLCMVGLAAGSAFGTGRMFLVPLGTNPSLAVPGTPFPVTVTNYPADYSITVGVYVDVTPDEEVKGTQTTFPCQFPCSGGGFVNVDGTTVGYDATRTDDLGEGYVGAAFPALDQGDCLDLLPPPGINGAPRVGFAMAGPPLGNAIPVLTRLAYVGQIKYNVENACHGTATITLPNEPDSAMRNENDGAIVFTTDGLMITIPTGQCCDGTSCLGVFTKKECDNAAGMWNPAKTCADLCQCQNNGDCNDGNACTNDVCTAGNCTHPSNVPAGQCCNPGSGALAAISDNNECTADSCDSSNGAVTHDAAALDGSACTDDGNVCSLDRCLAGACTHPDITAIPCTTDAECTAASGGASNTCGGLAANLCDCVANPPLSIECDDSQKPNTECFPEGDKVVLKVVLGGGTLVINGGQFRLVYDPSCMDFLSIAPGATCDPGSPFTTQIHREVNEVTGEIFYAVGIDLIQNGGSNDGGVLACLSFAKIGACTDCQVCFDDINPQHTYLSGPGGQLVSADFPNGGCGCHTQTNGVTTITVPEGGSVNADCDSPTAIVTWASPAAATDTCDGALDLTCTCSSTNPLVHNCGTLIAHGGEFAQGTTSFECCATNSCGDEVCGQWTVHVSDQTTMDVVIQLSPTMDPDQFTRCIEFGFYANCVEAPEIFKEEITFGPPFDFPGHATYPIKVPKGQFACITARDQAHTLRSTSEIECGSDGHLHATFKGDPFFGGNWLEGGNLDGSHIIDILDFGVLVSKYLKPGDVDNTCDDIKVDGYRDADINADGIVDSLDYAFIQRGFLDEDKNSCCPDQDGTAGVNTPVLSITVQELRATGRGDLAVADLNHDGVLDSADMEAFQNGVVPAPSHNSNPKKVNRH